MFTLPSVLCTPMCIRWPPWSPAMSKSPTPTVSPNTSCYSYESSLSVRGFLSFNVCLVLQYLYTCIGGWFIFFFFLSFRFLFCFSVYDCVILAFICYFWNINSTKKRKKLLVFISNLIIRWVYVYFTHARTHARTHTLAHTYTHTHAHTHSLSHTHIHTQTYTYRHTHTHTLSHTHSFTHTHKHKQPGPGEV